MDYMEDAKWEIENYLRREGIDSLTISDEQLSEMVIRYYKNFYSYEMDGEIAAQEMKRENDDP